MKKIKFTKLFGRFNYEIELKNDGITILTGPNGFGKSTILRCIEAVQDGIRGVLYLANLDFEKIELFFETEKFEILKDDEKLYINRSVCNIKELYNNIYRRSYRFGSYFRPMSEEIFFDKRTGKEYTVEEIISNRYLLNELVENILPITEYFSATFLKKLEKLKQETQNIFFIKEQRLIINKRENRKQEDKIINKIEELPEKFKKQITEISEKYSKVANEYDSSYPYRLFNEKNGINQLEYEKYMKEMKEKFAKLKEYDISEFNISRKLEFKKEYATALKIYFEDFNNKYKVYEDLINKFDLYISIINSRLKFKKIKISREEGIEVFSDSKKRLKLSELSSGEQQEIVLFYQLIFETPNESLLLIDEPEISLHIIWQKIFMEDLKKVVNMKGLNVIVATHSPQIINNYWENQIDLGELYGN